MILKKNINDNKWSDFINNTYQKNIYSDYKYLKNLNKDFNNYLFYEKDLPLIGAILFNDNLEKVPIFYNSIFISKKIKSPHKLNLICTEFINQILKYEKKIHLRLHYSVNDIRSFQWFNYNLNNSEKFLIKVFYTSILNIQKLNASNLINQFNSSRKNIINQAIKNEYFSEEVNDVNILNDLNQKSFKRKRSKNEILMASEIANNALINNIGSLIVTYDKFKNPFAASLFLHDDETSYYSVGGSIPDDRKNGSVSLNIYDQILNSIKLKKKNIDFVGVNSPNRGYFKTSFGGDTKLYFECKYK